MKNIALSIVLLVGLQACADDKPAAAKADVYAWGVTTIEALEAVLEPTFGNLVENSRAPDDIDYSRFNLVYDPNSSPVLTLSSADKDFLRDAGIISATALYCGLAWDEQNFLPMMQWQRSHLPEAEQRGFQISVIGTIHGFAMGGGGEWLESNPVDCSAVRPILIGNLFADKFGNY